MQAANKNYDNKVSGIFDLFAEVDDGLSVAPPLPDVLWSAKERLKSEYEVLGLYLTGHPIDEYKNELSQYPKVSRLADLSAGHKFFWVAALVIDIANFGNRVAITIDDNSARYEVSCFIDKFKELQKLLKIGEVLLFRLGVRENEEKDRLFVRLHDVSPILDARIRFMKRFNIKIHKDDIQSLNKLIPLIKENTPPNFVPIYDEQGNLVSDGCVPISLFVHDEFGLAKVQLDESRFRLSPSDDNLFTLQNTFNQNFKISFQWTRS